MSVRTSIPQLTGTEISEVLEAKFGRVHRVSGKNQGRYEQPALRLYAKVTKVPVFIDQAELREIFAVARATKIKVRSVIDLYRSLGLDSDEFLDDLSSSFKSVSKVRSETEISTITIGRLLKKRFKVQFLRGSSSHEPFTTPSVYMFCVKGSFCPTTREMVLLEDGALFKGQDLLSKRVMSDLIKFLASTVTTTEFESLAYKNVQRLRDSKVNY